MLAIHSVDGPDGSFFVSGSADHTVRRWDLKESKHLQKIIVNRPLESDLYKFRDHNQEVAVYAPDHILNTKSAMAKKTTNPKVCCFCFQGTKIFTGYDDGLICSWA